MKNKRKVAAILIFAMILTGTLGACSSKSKNGNADKEQYLNVALNAEPETLDPSLAVDSYSSIVISECEEALTRCEQDANGKDVIKPAGAESFESSKDGLTWTFKLRDNKWSDGQAVKASDYEYAIKRTLNPKNAAKYSGLLNPIKGAEAYVSGKGKAEDVGVKAVDDKTLVFTLESPCAYFLNLTYFKLFTPERKDYVEKYGEKYGTEAETIPSCGPFVLKSWTHKSKIELEKNLNYWDKDSVKLNKLTFKILEDEQARMNEVLNGSVDVASAEKKEWKDKFNETGKFNLISGYEPVTDYLFFNTKDKMFSNIKIRKAVSAAIDREDYVKTLFPSTRVAAYAFAPDSLQIGNDDFRTKAANLPVKTLLNEVKDPKAVFTEGINELNLGSDPSKITITLTAAGTNAKQKQIQEYLQQVLQKNLGCQVKIDYVDGAAYMGILSKHDFQITSMAWTGDYNDPMTFFDIFTSESGMNFAAWSNKTYDDNIEKAAAVSDQALRLNAFKENEDILVNKEAVCVPLDFRQRSQYERKYVKGYVSTLFGSNFECKYAYTTGRDSK
ncbi:MAG: peptide ABC transporter substrate-binding protein [Solirubrobacterales bacterium]